MSNTKNTKNTKVTKVAELSEGAKTALALIKEYGPLTVAQMKELGFTDANASHLVALKRRGLVDSNEVEVEVLVKQKRKVQKYFVTNADKAE